MIVNTYWKEEINYTIYQVKSITHQKFDPNFEIEFHLLLNILSNIDETN